MSSWSSEVIYLQDVKGLNRSHPITLFECHLCWLDRSFQGHYLPSLTTSSRAHYVPYPPCRLPTMLYALNVMCPLRRVPEIALGSKPPLVTRIARTGLGTRLSPTVEESGIQNFNPADEGEKVHIYFFIFLLVCSRNSLACGHRRISGRRFSPPKSNVCEPERQNDFRDVKPFFSCWLIRLKHRTKLD